MPNVKRMQFNAIIEAPASRVWDRMFSADSYTRWTSAFCEGSFFEGDWSEGSRMKFLAPSGDGMIAEIAESRPHEFLSIRHLGCIMGGVEDTESESVRAWAPVYENYTLNAVPEGTQVVVDQEVTPGSEESMTNTWNKALRMLKQICEDEIGG